MATAAVVLRESENGAVWLITWRIGTFIGFMLVGEGGRSYRILLIENNAALSLNTDMAVGWYWLRRGKKSVQYSRS
jgi:hypothetical protein